MDQLFSGGALAYFKVCVTLFGMISGELLATTSMQEFLAQINKNLAGFDRIEQFRAEMEGFYIDERLTGYIRAQLTARETMRHHSRLKQRFGSDRCTTTSPFCLAQRDTMCMGEGNLVVRGEGLLDNLKPGYFKVNESETMAERFAKKYTDDSFTDSLYRKRLMPRQEFGGLKSKLLRKSIGLAQSEMRTSLSLSGYKMRLNSGRTIPLDRLDASLMFGNSDREADLLVLRSGHVCRFKKVLMETKSMVSRLKLDFFESSKIIMYKGFSCRLKNIIDRAVYKLSATIKPSTALLVKNQMLRSSLQSGRRYGRFKGRWRHRSAGRQDLAGVEGYLTENEDSPKVKAIMSSFNGPCWPGGEDYNCGSGYQIDAVEVPGFGHSLCVDKDYMLPVRNDGAVRPL